VPNITNFLRNIVHKKRVERDLDDEIHFYLETLTQQGVAEGLSEEEARRIAHLELGSVGSLKDAVRDVRTGAMMERIWQDCRYAIRALWKTPGFTAAAVLVLALGIGANSAVFSLINAFLLKPLAVAEPGRLEGLYSRDTKRPDSYRAFSYPNYVDIRENNPVFSSLMAHQLALIGLKEGENTRRTFVDVVSSNYFSTLGVPILKGRPFSIDDEKPGRELKVIVSYSFWRRTGEDPQILGRKLRINDHLFTVIGITPEGFTGTTAIVSPEMFVPLSAYGLVMNDFESQVKQLGVRDYNALIVVGRLKPGITLHTADARLAVVASQMEKAFPAENKDQMLLVRPLSRLSVSTNPSDDGSLRVPATLLLSLAGIVLLIASLNLANMMMAKGATRRKEIAIRLAIGGGRRRIVQQLLTEGLMLAAMGGIAGLFLASWSTTLLIGSLARLAPLDLVYNAAPDARVVAGTLVFCVASTMIFGLFPAWKLSRPDVWLDLKENTGEDFAGHPRRLFSRGNLLVMAQLSLSLMMLAAAGLFVHSAVRVANIEPGFSRDNEILAEADASLINYDEARGRQLYGALRERLRRIPGIQSVAMAATVPFGMMHLGESITPAGVLASKEHPALFASSNIVTADYFKTLGIPLLHGRTFAAAESMPESKSRVAVLDEAAVDKLWPGGNAVGKHIRLNEGGAGGQGGICEVVGVVSNIREHILGARTEPHVYIPFGQQYQADMQIHLKVAARGPEAEKRMLETIRHEIHATDDRLPLLALTTMREHMESGIEIWVVRTGAHILEIFGSVALFLAIIGLYAINAHTVARRTREIGIRMALGADAPSTLGMILRDGLRVIAVGVGIGLLLAIGIGRLLAGFLYEVPRIDSVVIAIASLVLTTVALLACYLPARKASHVDPMIALRYE
jgi:predicted permease